MKRQTISITKVPGRKSPWMVTFYTNRVPDRKFFKTREDAESHKRFLCQVLPTGLSYQQCVDIMRIALVAKKDPVALCELGAKSLVDSGMVRISPTITFKDAADMLIQRSERKNCRTITINGYRAKNATLNRAFGARIAATIAEEEFEQFISRVPNRKSDTGKVGDFARNGYTRHIKMIYRMLGVPNPFPGLLMVRISRPVEFMTNDQVRTLFLAAKPHERGLLALAVFAGLRPTLLSKLPADCVDVAAKTIRIPNYLSKDRKDHLLEGETVIDGRIRFHGLPEVLWEWLRAYPFAPRNWHCLCSRLHRALGGWVQDYTRHTAATNYHALHGMIPTSNLLTHEGVSLLHKHYVGIVTRASAIEFYAITPNAIREIEATKPISPTHPPVNWPSTEELRELVATVPTTVIAKRLGCSDTLVARRCRQLGIQKPGPGHWQKVRFGRAVTRIGTSDQVTPSPRANTSAA